MFNHLKRIQVSILFIFVIFLFSCNAPTDDPPDNQFEFVIMVVSGNFQQGNNGEQLTNPIVIRFSDSQQTPRSNVPIAFEIICGGGSLSVTTTNTDSQGQAEVYWLLGNESDHILKVTSSDWRYAAEARYVYANTYFEIETQWISGIPFRMEYETIPHDNRILESNNFLTFSDAGSDNEKIIYSKMAEDAFYEIKQAFEIQNSEEFGINTDDSSTKITIYSSHDFSRNNMAFRFGFLLYGLESEFFSRWFGGDPTRLREWYQKDVKHETMHVIQFWLLGHDRYTHYEYGISWPEFWFSEGIAEYISGGSFTPIETMDQVNAWLQNPDHINPVSILRHDSSPVDDSRIGEYYPMFGLAVRYLLDENGLGRTFLDVKAMFSDMQNTESFRTSFETYMGITVEYYEENFFDLITDFLNQTGSD